VGIIDNVNGLAAIGFVLTFRFNEAVTGFDASDIVLSTGTAGTFTAVSATEYTLAVAPPSGGIGTLSVSVASGAALDTVANPSEVSAPFSLTYDTVPPTVSSVAISGAAGGQNNTLNAGDVVSVTVTMSKPTLVSGTPRIKLDIDGQQVDAQYASGSGSAALVFNYTIQPGQTDDNGIAIVANSLNLNGGSLGDVASRPATLTHAAVLSDSDYLVDTTPSTLSISSSASTLKGGETATISFVFSEDPLTSFVWDDKSQSGGIKISGGTLGPVSTSGTTRTATFTPTADVNAGSIALQVAAGAYTDAAGNSGGLTGFTAISFDTLAPAAPVISAVSDDVSPVTGAVAKGGSTNDTTLGLSGTAEANATVEIYDGTKLLGTAAANASGAWSFTTPALADGTSANFKAVAIDAAGNASADSSSVAVKVDTSAPV